MKCGDLHQRHRVCPNCGTYRGKEVVDVMKKALKKEQKIEARKKEAEEMAKASGAQEPKEGSLDAGKMSKK